MDSTRSSCVDIYLSMLSRRCSICSTARKKCCFFSSNNVFGDTGQKMNQKQDSRSFCIHTFHAIWSLNSSTIYAIFKMKRIFHSVVVAIMGTMIFCSCSNNELVDDNSITNYANNFEKVFGQVNSSQNFNTQKTVTIESSFPDAQGSYTLRVYDGVPSSKCTSLIGKFENLNPRSISSVKVDVCKSANDVYCVADNGETHKIISQSISSTNHVTAKFDASTANTNQITNDRPNVVTIAFEDLGSIYDYDFNDVVIKVEYTTGTATAVITLMSVGGTLPVKIYYNYNDPEFGNELHPLFSGMELHDAMGYSDNNTVLNANWKYGNANQGVDYVDFVVDEIRVPEDFVIGESIEKDGAPFILEVNGKQGQIQITSSTAFGSTPQALVVGKYITESQSDQTVIRTSYGLIWPKEGASIKDAYPSITTWMNNPNDISFLANEVESKLYDGYDPTVIEVINTNIPEGLEAVDLGLPSGTLWANMNVGATQPWEFGIYYAWGETEGKDYYDWGSYTHCDKSQDTCHDLGSDISGTEYDVAHEKWGGNWKLPTLAQIQELLTYCTTEWTTLNQEIGRKFTGTNGKSIFLPAAGYRIRDQLIDAGNRRFGFYQSSTQDPSVLYNNIFLVLDQNGAGTNAYRRYYGRSVRPVCKSDSSQ